MNSLFSEINFEFCIIAFIACFKKNNFYFRQKKSSLRSLFRVFPRSDPCGTLKFTLSTTDEFVSIKMYCILFVRLDLNQPLTIPLIP